MNIQLFQIARDAEDAPSTEAGFRMLPRGSQKEWGDYAAIRDYFIREAIDDETLYGFFPADFAEHSGLGAMQIAQFVENNPDNDVYNIFPFARDAACFLNVFEEGEFRHPGLHAVAQAYLKKIDLSLDLQEFITDFRTTTRAGYVLARPVFWKTWFDLCEKVYDIAEAGAEPLADQLNAWSTGTPPVTMKVLVTERIASLVLALDQTLRVAVFNSAQRRLTELASLNYLDSLPRLNAMKQNYLATGDIAQIDAFLDLRNSILLHAEQRTVQPVRAASAHVAPASAFAPPEQRDELVYGCITHVALPLRFPDFVTPIYLGEAQFEGGLNLRDLAPQWVPYHPIVGGMVGNFALRNYILRHCPHAKRIGVCMYRKFISRERISGIPAEDNWMMDVISNKQLAQQSFDSMLTPGEAPLLIGKTCGFTVFGQSAGYLTHYVHSHHVEDMLRFASEAVELGVLDKTEVETFFNEKIFFMGGLELGVFPADFWLKSIGDIESVAWACVQRYQMQREGYQSRAWAFCAERLGSFLLLRYLRARYPNTSYEQFMGQLNLITQDDQKRYVPSH